MPPIDAGTILIVDDDKAVRASLCKALMHRGYSVVLAADGREALRLFEQYPEVSVVLSDLVMPNREGIETIRAIRQRSAVRIVAMSGACGGRFLGAARALGADAILVKPFAFQELDDALHGPPAAPLLQDGRAIDVTNLAAQSVSNYGRSRRYQSW